MRVLIAPDSFKNSLSAQEVAEAVAENVHRTCPDMQLKLLPLSDGGEGAIDVLTYAFDFQKHRLQVANPLFQKITSFYYSHSGTAYIELSKASGLELLSKNEYNCLKTSTLGTGMLILDAVKKGFQKIVLFVGGSATVDAGMGVLAALGAKFLDTQANLLLPIGENLAAIHRIEFDSAQYKNISIRIATDVDNPLYGKTGAAYTYAAQKGANNQQIKYLDNSLRKFSEFLRQVCRKEMPFMKAGMGAAGGVPFGLSAFLNTEIVSGAELIFRLLNLAKQVSQADLVIGGEGKLDSQTLHNKLIFRLSREVKKQKKRLLVICGYFEGDENLRKKLAIEKIIPLAKTRAEIPTSIKNARFLLKNIKLPPEICK